MLAKTAAEESANFYAQTASLPSVIETESFSDFLDRFTKTGAPHMTAIDVLLLEESYNKPVFDDLQAHHERACALKLYKRTHYTQGPGTKDLPDDLKSAHRYLLAGCVNNHFPSYNEMNERDRKKWRIAGMVLVPLRNVAFETMGVDSSKSSTAPLSRTGLYNQEEPKSPRTPTLLGYGFGKYKEF
ncbi:hypothetical protein FKW77_007878 [Venturia effusa]|uniref:Uncharacterized protein n=1 Tax=Venturia effusa TaxID=50376 RepID=A0A517LBA6_9PEZI|nr:hypothetical protein FKW77_007878 [Venturia effusa]